MSQLTNPEDIAHLMRKHLYTICGNVANEENVFVSDDPMYDTDRMERVWFVIVPPTELITDEASWVGGGDYNTEQIGIFSIATHLVTGIERPDQIIESHTVEGEGIYYYLKQLYRGLSSHQLLLDVTSGPPVTNEGIRPVRSFRLVDSTPEKVVYQSDFELRFTWDLTE